MVRIVVSAQGKDRREGEGKSRHLKSLADCKEDEKGKR
jgi:hypothetical protein